MPGGGHGASYSLISEATNNNSGPPANQVRFKDLLWGSHTCVGQQGGVGQVQRPGGYTASYRAGHSLLGRNWLQSLVLDWAEINTLQHDQLQVVLDRHSAVFGSDLGALKGLEAKIAMPHPGSARLGPLHMPTGSW